MTAEEWEYRPVGRHDLVPRVKDSTYRICRVCGEVRWTWSDGYGFCPSRRERRRVGPWEPAPEDET